MDSARVIITRDSDLFGMVRKYRVLIDGHEATRIANGQEVAIPIAPGRHLVRVTFGRTHSNDLQLDLDPDTEAQVRCRQAGNVWTKFFFGRYWPRPPLVLSQKLGGP